MTSSASPATTDSNGFSQIGRYGTISLMKRTDSSTAITAFGIDADQLTFGRDPTCGVRLYYPDVSLVHCKIVFEERKAFLVVLGSNGLFVDGCKVYPNGSPSSSSTPTMIPLTNNSEFEIHGKRFRFTYPPKELRAALYASPARPANRALRLSMIHSTQVFSPRPSPDPRENLRILKSPLKNTFKSPYKKGLATPRRTNLFSTSKYAYNSPVKPEPTAQPSIEEDDQDEEEDIIVLVDGNHPRVVEDEKDLVILEDIEVPLRGLSPTSSEVYHQPPVYAAPPPPQTPARKRSLSRNTLHRAVLIRSAQRAVLKAERDEQEKEEEEEEMEVLDAVASDIGEESDEEVAAEADVREEEGESAGSGDENMSEEEDMVEDEEDMEERKTRKLTWRKSLERLWPFRSSSPQEEDENQEDDDNVAEDARSHTESEDEEQDEEEDIPAPLPPPQTPARRALGSFMTPQVHPRSKVPASTSNPTLFNRPPSDQSEASNSAQGAVGAGRYSLGGGEARRVVRTEQVWKVRDIVLPEPPAATSSSHNPPARAYAGPGVPGSGASGMASPARPSPRKVVDEEERKAIQERRRSALREVGPFFPGGVPGMGSSPSKASSSSSLTTPSSSSGPSPFKPTSPIKPSTQVKAEPGEDDADAVDTRSLLEKMKETVEGMKRRRSLAPATPARADPPIAFAQSERMSVGLGPRPVSPSKTVTPMMTDVAEEDEEEGGEKENEGGDLLEKPVFSLLRPGVFEGRTREDIVEVEKANTAPAEEAQTIPMDVNPVTQPTVLLDNDAPVTEVEVDETPLTKDGRVRKQKSASPVREGPGGDSVDRIQKARPKLKTPARQTKAKSEEDTTPADDTDAAPPPLPAVPKPTVRRGRKPVKQAEDVDDEPLAPTPAPAPVPAKRGRKAATAEPEEAPAPAPARRGRKPTVEPEEALTEAKAVPTKKGRKPAAAAPPAEDEAEQETASEVAAPVKRGRKAVATVAVVEEAAEVAPRRGRAPRAAPTAIPMPKTAARGKNGDEISGAGPGARRGTKAKPIEVGDEADPLDSIDAEEAVAAKPKRGKKVKEEIVEEGLDGAIAAVPTKPKAKPTALKTPAVRARTTTKTPATAPPAVQQDLDKENTPSSDGVEGEEPVKVRVSRTTRKAASGAAPKKSAKVKQEVSDEEASVEPEVPRGRVMRATRARTRT
ncbi:hypothetical protein FPV67DRAFT_158757 [Lyophyllum atratum]|nr:hypothetical protein FPV67DRAFT_158757 [Lyophyllum atratum]